MVTRAHSHQSTQPPDGTATRAHGHQSQLLALKPETTHSCCCLNSQGPREPQEAGGRDSLDRRQCQPAGALCPTARQSQAAAACITHPLRAPTRPVNHIDACILSTNLQLVQIIPQSLGDPLSPVHVSTGSHPRSPWESSHGDALLL